MMRGRADDLPPLHVLIVEDNDEQREVLVGLLEDLGCRVDAAIDGSDAIRQAAKLKPDVVLMDLGMPNMDGWNAIRHIRTARAENEHPLHVIALSAFSDARARQLAFEAGCNEYVVKPSDVRGALRAFVMRFQHRSLSAQSP